MNLFSLLQLGFFFLLSIGGKDSKGNKTD